MAKRKEKIEAKVLSLKQQLEQANAQLKDYEAREKEQQRKLDTRRKVVLGGLVMTHSEILMERHPSHPFLTELDHIMRKFIYSDRDRALFGLPPLPESDKEANKNELKRLKQRKAREQDNGL